MVEPALYVRQELKEKKVWPVIRECPDHRVMLVFPERQAHLAIRVMMACLDHPDKWDRPDHPDLMAYPVIQEPKENQLNLFYDPDHPVIRAPKVTVVFPDYPDPKDHPEKMDYLELPANLVMKA